MENNENEKTYKKIQKKNHVLKHTLCGYTCVTTMYGHIEVAMLAAMALRIVTMDNDLTY